MQKPSYLFSLRTCFNTICPVKLPPPYLFLKKTHKVFELGSCLYTLFYLYQTKSIFRPTSMDFNIVQLFGKPITKVNRLHNFCKEIYTDFCTGAFKGNLHIFSFFLNTHLGFSKFSKCFCQFKLARSRCFQKCIIC